MKIPLGNRDYCVEIDEQDFQVVGGIRWLALTNPASRTEYAYFPTKDRDGKKCILLMHRILLGLHHGDPRECDHINSNGLDNRRENIRVCEVLENRKNRQKNRNNSSGAKGVYKHRDKWRAEIRSDGRKYYLGVFATLSEAAAAYAEASKKLHGEFGRTG